MLKVAPAILEESMSRVRERMQSVSGLVPFVQVDICDGKFVPSITVGASADKAEFVSLRQLATETKLGVELDMMVEISSRVEEWLEAIVACGPGAVVLHYGSVSSSEDWVKVVATLREQGVVMGLGVHIDTPLSDVVELAHTHNFNYLQVMGIESVGYGGQEFSDKALSIIQEINKELPGMMLSVDGGVNLNTIESLKRAGVSQVAVGSAIFNASNKEEVIRLLQA
jgi:ribulose-phosphate 3-epimerase